ncbi:unnamed protein product [Rotaria socialis]|uniref:THO complex subunit 1 n=1 Tax=Rotaria socialis TaxID=392032 RepID=A0A821PM60_9BILA|nr:unnamed protein product [Rotaria socialis]CAF4805143.1 unnamed protein product [Rotaria socialis]
MIEKNSSSFEFIRQNVEVDLKKYEWDTQKVRDVINTSKSPEYRTAVEHAFRSVLFGLMEKQLETTHGTNLDDMEMPTFVTDQFLTNVRKLIGFAIEAVDNELAAATMPVYLFNDLFTYTTIDISEQIFVVMEEKASTWRSTIFFQSVKNILLRMCNDLLKRLSKTQKTVFSGRILTFLAQLFPLNEKSGLNQIGHFNTENVTKLTKTKQTTTPVEEVEKEKKMEVDEDGEIHDLHQKSSAEFYTNFWILQDFFSKPFQLWERTSWNTFVHNTNQVLDVFTNSQLDNVKTVASSDDSFFAKYLTSEKLLELQLNDVTFRQNILVQFLIIFQYLVLPVKFKQPQQSLNDEQSQWVKKATNQINDLLKQTGSNADVFTICIQHILKREEMWNLWKNNGCPDFSKAKLTFQKRSASQSAAPYRLSDTIRQSVQQASKRRTMNFEDLRSSSQQFIPSIRQFFEPMIEQLQTVTVKTPATDSTDNKEQTTKDLEKEREKLLQQDPSLVWRALRLLARQSPYFFVHNTQTVPSMAQFLVSTCEKIRREYMSLSTTATATSIASAAPTPPPATSTTHNEVDDEDTTMDDEPLENPPSTGENTNTDQEIEEETTTATTPTAPKVEEDDDDDNRDRRFSSTKRTTK